MTDPKSPIYSRNRDRRSAFSRRWIKSNYDGIERRSGQDRRRKMPAQDQLNQALPDQDLPVPEGSDSKAPSSLEKLLITNAIQLEALTRILLEKGYFEEEELVEMMNRIQDEYHGK